MRGFVRIGLTVAALGLGLTLAGCDDFDPTAIFDSDIFNTKKPLPGQRHPVFPEGTPGVSQGVPPELVKGYQQPAEAAAAPQTTATATPKQAAAEPSPRRVLEPDRRHLREREHEHQVEEQLDRRHAPLALFEISQRRHRQLHHRNDADRVDAGAGAHLLDRLRLG